MNQTFVGKVGGVTCSFAPFLFRVAKKAGVRAAAPRNASTPREWRVTFAERAFLPRKERLPPFVDAKTSGQALGCVLRNRNVTFFGRHRLNQPPMRGAIEMAIAFYIPTSDNVGFAEVRRRPTAESVVEMIEVVGELEKGE